MICVLDVLVLHFFVFRVFTFVLKFAVAVVIDDEDDCFEDDDFLALFFFFFLNVGLYAVFSFSPAPPATSKPVWRLRLRRAATPHCRSV